MKGRFFAKKTVCHHGHKHDSAAEAGRCIDLHALEKKGRIRDLQVHPKYAFVIGGKPVKMGNGQAAGVKLDFAYKEGPQAVAEDVKPKNGWMSRDVPLRFALFRHLFPHIELRVVS